MPNLNEAINHNLFTRDVRDSAANRGGWTINFSNGADRATAHTPALTSPPLPAALTPLSFVTAVAWSGTGLNPQISWTNTASTLDAVAVRVRDNGLTASLNGHFSASVISLQYFAPATNSIQLSLSAGHTYSIEIDQLATRTPFNALASTTADFLSTLNQSRSFFNYSANASASAAHSVYLPMVGTQPNGLPSYSFHAPVNANTPIFIDPQLAIGYTYKIGLGDPNFASVTLPTVNGTTNYTILLSDGQHLTVLPNQTFNFTGIAGFAGGVSAFEVLGISPSSALNPFDPNAFVTELTFVSAGEFTGTMDPITAAVPEPSTWAMMLIGFAGIGFAAYRQKNKSAAITA